MQELGRVGLIGDVHAEDVALAFVIEELRRLGAETLLQVGDIADGPGDLTRTVALLREHGVLAVRGNHDRWLAANQMRELPAANVLADVAPEVLSYLRELPVTRHFRSARGDVLLCHGLGSQDMAAVKPGHFGYAITANTDLQQLIASRRYSFVLNGHTHEPMLRSFGLLSIINAGTLLRTGPVCFTLVDFVRGELFRYRHPAGPLTTALEAWTLEQEQLADSPPESFREPPR